PSQTGSESEGSGSLRQGIVTEVGPEGRVRVNCGLQHPISLVVPSSMTVAEGERVTVRISSRRPVRAKLVDAPIPGLTVMRTDLSAALDHDDAGVTIGTSRHGEPLSVRRLDEVVRRTNRDGMTVAFGSPGRGLPEMFGVEPEGISTVESGVLARFDLWLNTVPNQGSGVVRTEEAMFASLGCLTLNIE
ncbi:putative RNA uridine N3 methyltransferase, partial [Haladaptatus sp.]|uniref:putative RNA uridine N3 methyltransferase n=1 Tax=Haladaptatus sp. TaxID=1973141 RepID=UPI003C55CAFF